jgi:cell division protein ZapA (FtsZ GTPase activity inhibitor)
MKATIGNKELNLKGDDENLIALSVKKVNFELNSLGYKKDEEPDVTGLILVALNLAEKLVKLENKIQESEKQLIKEIAEMSGYVEKNFK